jgi:hypothetical protein
MISQVQMKIGGQKRNFSGSGRAHDTTHSFIFASHKLAFDALEKRY